MKKCLFLIIILFASYSQGQEVKYWFSEYFSPQNEFHQLKKDKLIKNSEILSADSTYFTRDEDYTIDYDTGLIKVISDKVRQEEQVKIEYKVIPQDFLNSLYLYKIKLNQDSTYTVEKRQKKSVFLDNSKLLIKGSKTFALSFSENRDLDVNQSLYLKLSGEIASNLFVEAQLSDSNSPISTEGSSRELSSLDKVFISLFNDNFELSFGDLSHEISNTSYMNYLIQFEGLKLGVFESNNKIYSGPFQEQNSSWAALAVSKGKNGSYRFTCIEGKQGPYFIYISDSQDYVSIIANSEKVFLDGIKAERGIDYFIDYSEGSITFENIVTSETQVYVTFEYTDEKYRNNLYISSSQYRLTDFFNISLHAIHRQDDKDNPLEDIHTQEDIQSFKVAGDTTIFANGIYEVETGQGNYIAELNSQGETIYTYVGSQGQGNYNIYFSYLGPGQGAYIQNLPNQFEYVGQGNGDYQPVRKLTPPQSLSNYDLVVRLGLENIYLEMESLLTQHDKNTFSDKDDSDNQGNISKIALNYQEDNETWATKNIISYEYKSKNVSALSDLENPLELTYGGNETRYDSLASKSRQFLSSVNIKNYFKADVNYKEQDVDDYSQSNLFDTNLLFLEQAYSPEIEYRYTRKSVDYDIETIEKSKYLSNYFQTGKKLAFLQARFNLLNELDQESYSDYIKTGYKYKKYTYILNTLNLTKVNFSSSYWYDDKASLINDTWQDMSQSQTVSSNVLVSLSNTNTNIEYTFREIDGKKEDIEDNTYNKISINSTHTFFNNGLDVNYNYKINNLEFYPKVRELQYIGDGAGAYDSLGFYQDQGDFDWLYVNSGQPELSTELNLAFNTYLRLNRFIKSNFWKNITAEFRTIITEDSRTSEKVKLYLLNPEVLMNKNTTLYGRNNLYTSYAYTSDTKKFNYRLSLEWDKTLDNRYQNESKTRIRIIDNEIMLRRLNIGNLGNQITYREEDDTRYKQEIKEYSSTLKYQNTIWSNYLYNGNLKGKLEKGQSRDENNDYEIMVLSMNNIITANLAKKYLLQINTDIIYTWDQSENSFIYLAEKRPGYSMKWNISAKYNYNQYITLNLSYFGNKYPKNKMENNLNIEIKAEF